jgi:hypothetical protein
LWFSESFDHYKLAAFHRQTASVALGHALADGGASLDGYPEVPPEVVEFVGEGNPIPTFAPVPTERAEAVVAANTALAAYAAAQAAEATMDGRLVLGGAGAVALTGSGLLYPLASIAAERAAQGARAGISGLRASRTSRRAKSPSSPTQGRQDTVSA